MCRRQINQWREKQTQRPSHATRLKQRPISLKKKATVKNMEIAC